MWFFGTSCSQEYNDKTISSRITVINIPKSQSGLYTVIHTSLPVRSHIHTFVHKCIHDKNLYAFEKSKMTNRTFHSVIVFQLCWPNPNDIGDPSIAQCLSFFCPGPPPLLCHLVPHWEGMILLGVNSLSQPLLCQFRKDKVWSFVWSHEIELAVSVDFSCKFSMWTPSLLGPSVLHFVFQ